MIKIIQDPWNNRIDIFVFTQDFSKGIKRVLNGDMWIELSEGQSNPKPTLSLESFDVEALVNALSELGVKTDNDHKLQGKLEAVNYHLEDLRMMLKLPSRQKVYLKKNDNTM